MARYRNPAAGLLAPYLSIVNSLLHLGVVMRSRRYNPGAWTAGLLLLPGVIYSAAAITRATDELLDGERAVNELVERLGMSQPAVSKHLRVLRDAGMVVARIDAQRRCYRLEPAALAEIDAWLAPYRKLWAERLDALEAHLDRRDQT